MNQEKEDSRRRPLWSEGSAHAGEAPGPEFAQDVLKKASRKVTIREYLFVFLSGFFGIILGILDVFPKKSKNETKES